MSKEKIPVLSPFKGKQYMDAGYVFAPYIPMESYKFPVHYVDNTIILKKHTHKVFNKIRLNELGMRENYMINIKHINDNEIDAYVKSIQEKFKH